MEENAPSESAATPAALPTTNEDSALEKITAMLTSPPLADTDSTATLGKRSLKPISTEQDIIKAKPLEQLKLGDGLYIWVNKKGDKKTYKFRSHINGLDNWVTVGQYPALSIEDAKKKVDTDYRAKLESARQKSSNSKWNFHLTNTQRVSKSDSEKFPSFHSVEDAAQLIRSLKVDNSPSEIHLAIWLQMLMPSRNTEILIARREDFNLDTREWTVKLGQIANLDKTIQPQVEYISTSAHYYLDKLFQQTGRSGYLFPRLCNSNTSTTDRNKIITKAIDSIWNKYPIKPAMFKNFFITAANRDSYFKPEFIKAMITHKDGINSIYNSFYCVPQKKALIEWWGQELMRLKSMNPPTLQNNPDSNIPLKNSNQNSYNINRNI